MWANNVLWPTSAKQKKASKKWHRKALMIDTRKTKLVFIGMENAQSSVTQNADSLEER